MPSLLVSWSTWVVLALFYAYQFIQRIVPNIIMDDIACKYHVNANEIGHFTGIYYVGYIIMHIPLGIALDHFNARIVITLSVLMTVIGFAPLVYTDNFIITTYGRLLIGAGSSGAAVGAFTLIRLGFGEKKFPRMLGLMVTIGLLGATFGSGPLARLISYAGLKETLNYIIYFGILLSVLTYCIIPSAKSGKKFVFKSLVNDFQYLFSNKLVLLVAVLGGLMIGPLEGFADAWSNPYLKTVYKVTNEQASDITQLIYIGMATGLMIVGYIFERTKSYYGLLIVSCISMMTCFVLLLAGIVKSLICLKVVFFIIGFFCSYQILVIAKSISLVRFKHATFVSSVVNMIMMGFGYVSHRVIGKTLHYCWDGHLGFSGQVIYTNSNFYNALLILPISLLIAMIGFISLSILSQTNKKNTY